MFCQECDAETVRGDYFCEKCAGTDNCSQCGAEMTGVDRNLVEYTGKCGACQQKEQEEYLTRLRAVWCGESRPEGVEGYRFPTPPARFWGATTESISKDLLGQLLRVVVDGEMGALVGPVGVGKTHAMWALVFAVVSKSRRKTIQLVDWSDLCLWASQCDSFGDHGAEMRGKMNGLASCGLLLVDEFGITKPRDNQFHQIHKMLNQRYAAKRPTLLATTADWIELAESMAPGVVSRVCGGHVIELNGADRRIGQKSSDS